MIVRLAAVRQRPVRWMTRTTTASSLSVLQLSTTTFGRDENADFHKLRRMDGIPEPALALAYDYEDPPTEEEVSRSNDSENASSPYPPPSNTNITWEVPTITTSTVKKTGGGPPGGGGGGGRNRCPKVRIETT